MKAARKSLAVSALALCLMSTQVLAEELRFTVWTGNEAHLKMLNGIADSFKATHPDVTVKFETIPPADYTQKLTFQIAGGNPPDLGWMMEDAAPTFVKAGVLTDIGPSIKAAEGYEFGDLSQAAMGLWQDGDKVYGIPFSTSPFMIYYNKAMFDKAGLEDPLALAAKGEWNMDKFQEVAKKLTEANGTWGFEFKDGEGYASRMMHALMPPIRAYGGDAWANGECGFDKPEAIAAVKQLHDMVFKDKSIVPPGEQGDYYSGKIRDDDQPDLARLEDAGGRLRLGHRAAAEWPGRRIAGHRPGSDRRIRPGQAEGTRRRVRRAHDEQGERRHHGAVLPAGAQVRSRERRFHQLQQA